jgi:glycosyltransferase involved in cell wall biosynthesis
MNKPVRVCFVIDRLFRGGTELQLLQLIEGLNRERVEPILCLLDGEDEQSRELAPKSCEVLRLGVRSLHRPSTLFKAWRFAKFLRSRQIDIVQTIFPDSMYFAAPIARLMGVRHVIRTRRDLGFWMKPINRMAGRIYNLFITATVANCEACREAVVSQEKVARDSVIVIENGLDMKPFAKIPPVGTANGRMRKIGMVANLRKVKGPEVFVNAAKIVAEKHPDVVFQLAGNTDDYSRQLIKESGVEHRFELKGNLDNIPHFLSDLDIAVLTSHSEGLSNTILEYMAAGRPIVATAVGGNVEMIESGVHGLLTPPGNHTAVASAIDRILCDPKLKMSLGAACKERIHQKCSLESTISRYETFYLNLAEDRDIHERSG